MATTLKARAGSACKATFSYLEEDGTPIDVTDYVAQFQLRSAAGSTRIILSAEADSDILTEASPSVWELFLGTTITSTLPTKTIWELELINSVNPEDVITVDSGIILTEPQVVTKIL